MTAGRRDRLVAEPGAGALVGREVVAEDLHRHPARQHRVVGDPHRGHAAACVGDTSRYRPPSTRPGLVNSTAALWPSPDGLERHSDDTGPGVGADDGADHAGDDVVAGEDRFEHLEQLVEIGALPCSTARCSIFPSAAFAASSFNAFERVRTLPASSTIPSRSSTTGLIDSTVPSSARVAHSATPLQEFERVERGEELGAVAPIDHLLHDRLERVAVGRPPSRGETEVAEAHRRAP